MKDICKASDIFGARVIRGSGQHLERALAQGEYFVRHIRGEKILSEEFFKNVVCNEGKNFVLDSAFQTAYTPIVGPFMGLTNSGATPAVGDTMASHGGWTEVSTASIAARLTTVGNWNAAASGSKALTAAISFTCLATGVTVAGCFLVFGPSSVATQGSTAGKLWSVGNFGAAKALVLNDVLQVSYSTSL